KELKTLAGEQALGVFDPQDQLKPLLKQSQVDFEDLEQNGLENFRGRLAILGPLKSPERAPADFGRRIKALARAGRAVIWIQTPSRFSPDSLLPVCLIREGDGAIAVIQS